MRATAPPGGPGPDTHGPLIASVPDAYDSNPFHVPAISVGGRRMRAAIYARVSKDDEGKSDSVPVQLSECRAFAAQQGLTVIAEFSDDGI